MAVVTMLNSRDMPRDINLAGVTLFGNPYWSPQSSQGINAGTATRGRGTFAGRLNVPDQYRAVTKDFCNGTRDDTSMEDMRD
ncbi:hypothetical protein PYCC9005_004426 [Savitreella phatthalungensis]